MTYQDFRIVPAPGPFPRCENHWDESYADARHSLKI